MAAHGFRQPDLDDAWALLRAAWLDRFEPPARLVRPDDVEAALWEWFSRWVAIAGAALRRHDAQAHQSLTGGLAREREKVVPSTATFVDRVRALAPAARALLAHRGLTDEELERGLAICRQRMTGEHAPGVPARPDAAAVEASWAWYREWSVVARTSIREPALLRALGFAGPAGRPKKGRRAAPVAEAPETEE